MPAAARPASRSPERVAGLRLLTSISPCGFSKEPDSSVSQRLQRGITRDPVKPALAPTLAELEPRGPGAQRYERKNRGGVAHKSDTRDAGSRPACAHQAL